MAVIVLISFRSAFAGLLKDHAVAVFYVLTTRSSTRSPYTTSMDSTDHLLAGLKEANVRLVELDAQAAARSRGQNVSTWRMGRSPGSYDPR
jgi:hypothetical protein